MVSDIHDWLRLGLGALLASIRLSARIVAAASTTFLLAAHSAHAQTTLSVSPASIPPGGTVTVTWSGIPGATPSNWIGLYTPGTPTASHLAWIYVSCSKTTSVARASGSCPFVMPSGIANGTYEMRLHTSSWLFLAKSGSITVSATTTGGGNTPPTLSVTPATSAAGSTLTVTWSGSVDATGYNAWIGLYPPGAGTQGHISWIYTSCSKTGGVVRPSGSCPFVIPSTLAAGNYEMRLNQSASYVSTPVTVTATSGGGTGGGTTGNLTVNVANASSTNIRVYPSDSAGLGDGVAALTRNFSTNSRVWLSAPLRSGNNYFIKWQRNGVDYDAASTTSVLMDTTYTLTAVYETPACSGIAVAPGVDSIKAAIASAPRGSTFCIKAGVHRFTSAVVARANDKFIGEPGAVLNGSKVLTSFVQQGSYWVVSGQTQQEPLFAAASCAVESPACVYPEKVFLSGQDLTQVTRLADLGAGQFFFDYAADKIYLFDNPANRTVEATTGSGGIIGYIGGNQGTVTIKNLLFEKFGGGDVAGSAHSALKAAENWTIENNEFRQIGNVGVVAFGRGLLRNNNIHHSGRYGVNGDSAIVGNVISFNNTDGFETDLDAGGTKFHSTRDLVIRGNIVAGNKGPAMWADFDNYNTTYENNIVENNSHVGIFHEISCLAVIKNNVARGNNFAQTGKSLWWDAQIYTRSSKDVEIVGNDVNAIGAASQGIGLRGGDAPKSGPNCGSIDSRNISVHDNVIRMDTADASGIVGADAAGYALARNLKFSNNTYYLTNPSAGYFWHDTATGLTRDQWQARGQDTTGRFLQN